MMMMTMKMNQVEDKTSNALNNETIHFCINKNIFNLKLLFKYYKNYIIIINQFL